MRALGCTAVLALCCAVSSADTILLKNGSVLRGKIVEESPGEVVIRLPDLGKLTVSRSRIEEVRKDAAPDPLEPPQAKPVIPMAPRPAPVVPVPEEPPSPRLPASPPGPAAPILDAYRARLTERGAVGTDLMGDCLKKLAPLGRSATSDLTRELVRAEDWRVRLLVVQALVPLMDPAAVPALIHTLGDTFRAEIYGAGFRHDEGFRIREESVKALLAIGTPAHAALLRTASNRNHPDQVHAVTGLERLDVAGESHVLIGLAKDRTQRDEVRRGAVRAMTKLMGEPQQALVRLLPDPVLAKEVDRALKSSRDPSVIQPLMVYVRRADRDFDLARRAAFVIHRIDRAWAPSSVRDHVDFLLLFHDQREIRKRLGDRAMERLHHWRTGSCEPLKEAAEKALSHY